MITESLQTNTERIQDAANSLKNARREIDTSGERILDYFWDAKQKRIRDVVPKSVIDFFEIDDRAQGDSQMRELWANITEVATSGLEVKGYIQQVECDGMACYKLTGGTDGGVAYMNKEHPALLALWEKLLTAPPTVSLLVGIITFIGTVLGIIQFVIDRYH